MSRKSITLILTAVFVVLLIGLVGCSNEASDGTVENEVDNQENDSQSDSLEGQESDKKSFKNELGDLKVWFGGEVKVEEEKIVVNGESNLLPGIKLDLSLFEEFATGSLGEQIIGYDESTYVEEDGTFYAEIPKPEGYSDAELTITVWSNQSLPREAREHYGDDLKNMKGPFIYIEHLGQRNRARAVVRLDNLEDKGVYEIKEPEWYDLPEDYGSPHVWIESEVSNDHESYYVHIRSNLLEGTYVSGRIVTADGQLLFESLQSRHINPDGSLDLVLNYNNLVKDMYILIESERNNWKNVIEAYGENGELLEGEYVVEKEDGSKMLRKEIPLEFPELDRHEEVDMTNHEEEIKLQVPDQLLFDFDESKLKSVAKDTLDEIIKQLEKLDNGTVIHINGHTDSQGNADYNMRLSEERAESVYEYLMGNGNLDHLDIQKKGYGETKPIASNDDDEGRARNRRVEIVINPN